MVRLMGNRISRAVRVCFGVAASVGILGCCHLGGVSAGEIPNEMLAPRDHWRQTVLPVRGGTIGYRVDVVVREEGGLDVSVNIGPDHQEPFFVFDPAALGNEVRDFLVHREHATLVARVGAPGLREDGLLKMVYVPGGKGYDMSFRLAEEADLEDVRAVRIGLLFLPDPTGAFQRLFNTLEDTGITWSTEVGSEAWCLYMSRLVYDEVLIPIRTNIKVCQGL